MSEDNKDQLLKDIMNTNEIPDFVLIENDTLSESDKTEVIPTEAIVCKDKVQVVNKDAYPVMDLTRLAIAYVQGHTTNDLAKIFGVTPAYINTIKNSEKFKQILTLLNAEIVSTARTFLTASGLKAVKTLLTCMDSRDDRVKLNAATQVLDRIGLKNPDQIEIIQKGDQIQAMSEEELMHVIKLGIDEIKPHTKVKGE